jgi:hypothetical protein
MPGGCATGFDSSGSDPDTIWAVEMI